MSSCYLRALSEWLLMDTQEVRSSCLSLAQNLLRLRQVLSVILVQPFKFNTSMFLQFCANVLGDGGQGESEVYFLSHMLLLYKILTGWRTEKRSLKRKLYQHNPDILQFDVKPTVDPFVVCVCVHPTVRLNGIQSPLRGKRHLNVDFQHNRKGNN